MAEESLENLPGKKDEPEENVPVSPQSVDQPDDDSKKTPDEGKDKEPAPREVIGDEKKNVFERGKDRLLNIPIFAWAVIVAIVLGWLGSALKTLKDLDFFPKPGPTVVVQALPIEDPAKLAKTFELPTDTPTVELNFVSELHKFRMKIKPPRRMKCNELCQRIASHFGILKAFKTSDAGTEISLQLVINFKDKIDGDLTLHQKGVKDGDFISIGVKSELIAKNLLDPNLFFTNDQAVLVMLSEKSKLGQLKGTITFAWLDGSTSRFENLESSLFFSNAGSFISTFAQRIKSDEYRWSQLRNWTAGKRRRWRFEHYYDADDQDYSV